MKHTDRYGVAAIASALASQNQVSWSSRARRIVSRVGVAVSRRFRTAVLLLLLASLLVSSTPSAPNSFARVSVDSGITANLRASANRLAANLYQSLHDSYASTVNSLSGLEPKVLASSSSAFIPTPMLVLGAPTNLTVTSASNTSISLSWTSPGGAVDHYLVERSQSPQGPFTIIASPAATNHPDNTVSGGALTFTGFARSTVLVSHLRQARWRWERPSASRIPHYSREPRRSKSNTSMICASRLTPSAHSQA